MTPMTNRGAATHALRPPETDSHRFVLPADLRRKWCRRVAARTLKPVAFTPRSATSLVLTPVASDVPPLAGPTSQTQTA